MANTITIKPTAIVQKIYGYFINLMAYSHDFFSSKEVIFSISSNLRFNANPLIWNLFEINILLLFVFSSLVNRELNNNMTANSVFQFRINELMCPFRIGILCHIDAMCDTYGA